MKANIEAGILALQGFYQVVNTKEKAILLILVWLLVNLGGLTYRFATVEAIERLMRANCEYNHGHSVHELKAVDPRSTAAEKNKNSIKSSEPKL